MYKVFINDKCFCFTNNKELIKSLSNCLVINFFSTSLITELYQLLKKDSKITYVVFNVEDVESAFYDFQHYFKLIRAAGGWVRNREGKSLFIFRLGKWDLPKGKIEIGEQNDVAAIREVQEECGIANLNITKQLNDTFHLYELNDELILKQTHWYEMSTDFEGELVPQLEEDITDAVWLSDEEIGAQVFPNTYASIKELLVVNLG